ncbi:MAG: tetratricopeptide repeat protein [Promethearchaeia archaeon]
MNLKTKKKLGMLEEISAQMDEYLSQGKLKELVSYLSGELKTYSGKHGEYVQSRGEKIPVWFIQGRIYELLGRAYYKIGNFPKSLRFYREGLEIYRENGYRSGLIMSYLGICINLIDLDENADLEKVEDLLETVERLITKHDMRLDKSILKDFYLAKIRFFELKGDFRNVFRFIDEVCKLKRGFEKRWFKMECYAYYKLKEGKYLKAVEYYLDLIDFCEQHDITFSELRWAGIYQTLAAAYDKLSAGISSKELKKKGKAQWRHSLMRSYLFYVRSFEQKAIPECYKEKMQYIRKRISGTVTPLRKVLSEALCPECEVDRLRTFGYLHYELGEYEKSREYLERLLALQDEGECDLPALEHAEVHHALADCYELGREGPQGGRMEEYGEILEKGKIHYEHALRLYTQVRERTFESSKKKQFLTSKIKDVEFLLTNPMYPLIGFFKNGGHPQRQDARREQQKKGADNNEKK